MGKHMLSFSTSFQHVYFCSCCLYFRFPDWNSSLSSRCQSLFSTTLGECELLNVEQVAPNICINETEPQQLLTEINEHQWDRE